MDKIVIIGTAPGWEDDLQRFKDTFEGPFDVMVINDAGVYYLDYIHHWASLHPNLWFKYTPTFFVDGPEYALRRERSGGNIDYQKHSHMELPKPHFPDWNVWKEGWKTGSSALFGVYVALQIQYKKIVTLGVMLQEKPYIQYQQGWLDKQPFMKGVVKGFGGWPESVLGRPYEEWWNYVGEAEHSGSVGDTTGDA